MRASPGRIVLFVFRFEPETNQKILAFAKVEAHRAAAFFLANWAIFFFKHFHIYIKQRKELWHTKGVGGNLATASIA